MQHGQHVSKSERVAYVTNPLIEDVGSAVDALEAAAIAGPVNRDHSDPEAFFARPFLSLSSSGPVVLAATMEMLASEVESSSKVLTEGTADAVTLLLRCWRIVAHHADVLCAVGSPSSIAVFHGPLVFALKRFSPLSRGSSVRASSPTASFTEVPSLSDGGRKELECFIIASLIASMRIACLRSAAESIAAGGPLIAGAFTLERRGLEAELLVACGLYPSTGAYRATVSGAATADDSSATREGLMSYARVFRLCSAARAAAGGAWCLTLNAAERFPLPPATADLWVEGPAALESLASAGDNGVRAADFALAAVGARLLSLCEGWSRERCTMLTVSLERQLWGKDYTFCSGGVVHPEAISPSFFSNSQLRSLFFVADRIVLAVGVSESGSPLAGVERSPPTWEFEGACSLGGTARGALTAQYVSEHQHRCLTMVRAILSGLFSSPPDGAECSRLILYYLAASALGTVTLLPLTCELLSAAQIPQQDWWAAVGRNNSSSATSASLSRLLSARVHQSLLCPPRVVPSGEDASGALRYRYPLAHFIAGVAPHLAEDEAGGLCNVHTGDVFSLVVAPEARLREYSLNSEGDADEHVTAGWGGWLSGETAGGSVGGGQTSVCAAGDGFWAGLAAAPLRAAAHIYATATEADMAEVFLSPRGVASEGLSSGAPNAQVHVCSTPFSSPSEMAPPALFGWAIAAAASPLVAAEGALGPLHGVAPMDKAFSFGQATPSAGGGDGRSALEQSFVRMLNSLRVSEAAHMVMEAVFALQAAITRVNARLSRRGLHGLRMLEESLDASLAAAAADDDNAEERALSGFVDVVNPIHSAVSEEELLAPMAFVSGGEPYTTAFKDLVLHCCTLQSPFSPRPQFAVPRGHAPSEGSVDVTRNYLRESRRTITCHALPKEAGAFSAYPLVQFALGGCTALGQMAETTGNTFQTLKRRHQAAQRKQRLRRGGRGVLVSEAVFTAVARAIFCRSVLLSPADMARIAACCISGLSPIAPRAGDTQSKADRALCPPLIVLQQRFPCARTPFVMRTAAAIYAREKSYVLPDTNLLRQMREDLVIPWQPDLSRMYRPAFHRSMLLATCALVHLRGLPVEVVLWGIRVFVPCEMQDASAYEKGAAVLKKCTVA